MSVKGRCVIILISSGGETTPSPGQSLLSPSMINDHYQLHLLEIQTFEANSARGNEKYETSMDISKHNIEGGVESVLTLITIYISAPRHRVTGGQLSTGKYL